MNNKGIIFVAGIAGLLTGCMSYIDANTTVSATEWAVDSQSDWESVAASKDALDIMSGTVVPSGSQAAFVSSMKRFSKKQKADSLVFEQIVNWDNWEAIENVGPAELRDAPVFISVKNGEYWIMGKNGNNKREAPQKKPSKKGKKPRSKLFGGYHAWLSSDMKNWELKGMVSEEKSKWVTTAEYKDGAFYIYYDNPNDEDPHLIIDHDLSDGKLGEDVGMVFEDPSHGSDCSVIRDVDGEFHVIYENWDPINASKHSWDSPLAGHAVSPDGQNDFRILPPAIDHRTTPTGEFGEFRHPHNKDFPMQKYEVHKPEQNAYGDFETIKVGDQYYLFADFHPAGEKIKIGMFTSDSLDKEFTFIKGLGKGHPDPTIGFAEGKFYLITQTQSDYISDGPWVDGVEARAGVDTDNDGKVDIWTDWQNVKESYKRREGFAKVIDKTPASLDMSSLPEGYGFAFEFKTKQGVKAQPVIDSVVMSFSK